MSFREECEARIINDLGGKFPGTVALRSPYLPTMRKHSGIVFVLLAFLLSWYPWALKEVGLNGRGSGGINPLGVFVAAMIAAGVEGDGAFKRLMRGFCVWNVAFRWYAAALLIPVAIAGIAAGANVAFGAALPSATQLAAWPAIAGGFLIHFFFVGFGEEPGWRGFLLPRLLERYPLAIANMLLYAIWALWHIPIMLTQMPPAHIPPFILAIGAGTMIHTWLYRHTRGSIPLQMMMHAMVNAFSAGYVFSLFSGTDLTRLRWLLPAAWYGVAAVVYWVDARNVAICEDSVAA